jgi:hypothetical protein
MTIIAGITVIGITGNPAVRIVHVCLVVCMTGDATEHLVIRGVGMAIAAGGPCSVVMTRVNRKILNVVIESRRYPGSLIMTHLAIGGILGGGMGRIVGLVVIVQMTSDTGGWQNIVVIILVAGRAIKRQMCSCKYVIITMDRERGRCPARISGMAVCTGSRNIYGNMIGIGRLVIICLVTTHAGGRQSIGVVIIMATVTISRQMGACEGIIIIMNGESSRFPSGDCGMAIRAGSRDTDGSMRRIGGLIVICLMTSHADTGYIRVIIVMAAIAISG